MTARLRTRLGIGSQALVVGFGGDGTAVRLVVDGGEEGGSCGALGTAEEVEAFVTDGGPS